MNITSRFNINQQVWSISKEQTREWQKCGPCDGTGNVVLKDGKERICPECYGRLGKYIYKDCEWQVGSMMTIGKVRVEITNFQKDDTFDNIGHYRGDGHNVQSEDYMMYETGIGSGSIWHMDKLFASSEEAFIECGKRNKEAAPNETKNRKP